MNDDELLERAAKAAGIKYTTWHHKPAQVISYGNYLRETRFWDPLTDDGDAFRLAVKLHVPVEAVIAFVAQRETDWETDPYAATRRAIVRAAATLAEEPK